MHKIVISAVFSYFTTVRAVSHTASSLAEHLLLLDLVVAVSAHGPFPPPFRLRWMLCCRVLALGHHMGGLGALSGPLLVSSSFPLF